MPGVVRSVLPKSRFDFEKVFSRWSTERRGGCAHMHPDGIGRHREPLKRKWAASSSHRRLIRAELRQARAWLEARTPAEEILILAANADAANELVREVALLKGAAFGWHRLSLPQFAAVLAAPLLAERGIVPLGPLGVQAICARVVNRLAARISTWPLCEHRQRAGICTGFGPRGDGAAFGQAPS